MKYERPIYGDARFPVYKKKLRNKRELDLPAFDLPVTPKENFMLAAGRKTPYWMPSSLYDLQSLMAQELVTGNVRGMQCSFDVTRMTPENYTFYDWFNTNWTYVASAGGPMLTPGFVLCEDITQWEKDVVFPDLREWDFKTAADEFMQTRYDPTRALHIDIGIGATERLVSVMGGYTEAMLALAVEPEAVRDFLNRFADFTIEYVDLIAGLYPVNMMTYHDDWGTERDTFWSEKMMEEIVYEPTKRIVDHIKSKGILFEFHCCGNIKRFLPYMIDIGMDFLQLQRRANDIPGMKAQFGDKIGFNLSVEDTNPGETYPKEEMAEKIRKTVDLYGKSGGAYLNIFAFHPETAWNITSELFCYSREYYDKERTEA
jgi:hypothetical protein